jgi:hypothetical protein
MLSLRGDCYEASENESMELVGCLVIEVMCFLGIAGGAYFHA